MPCQLSGESSAHRPTSMNRHGSIKVNRDLEGLARMRCCLDGVTASLRGCRSGLMEAVSRVQTRGYPAEDDNQARQRTQRARALKPSSRFADRRLPGRREGSRRQRYQRPGRLQGSRSRQFIDDQGGRFLWRSIRPWLLYESAPAQQQLCGEHVTDEQRGLDAGRLRHEQRRRGSGFTAAAGVAADDPAKQRPRNHRKQAEAATGAQRCR